MTTPNLPTFLAQRYDEQEAVAKAATEGPWESGERIIWSEGSTRDPYVVTDGEAGDGGAFSESNAIHIATHDPAYVLADLAAKRAIVEEHAPVDYSALGMESPNACRLCGADLSMGDWEWSKGSFPCPTLRALAQPFADHPDFRPEWKL